MKRPANPYYEVACDLARGFFCGDCKDAACEEWKCLEDGCCSLRDGIYEELKAAARPV